MRQNLNNLYHELTHRRFGGRAPDVCAPIFGGASPPGLNGRRNNLGVVADVDRRTQTDVVLWFSEGKVSRPLGRGTDRKKTQDHRRCGGVSPHKPPPNYYVGRGCQAAFSMIFRYPSPLGLGVKGKRAVKRTEGSHANDRPPAPTQTTLINGVPTMRTFYF